jgi:hypothetical protein
MGEEVVHDGDGRKPQSQDEVSDRLTQQQRNKGYNPQTKAVLQKEPLHRMACTTVLVSSIWQSTLKNFSRLMNTCVQTVSVNWTKHSTMMDYVVATLYEYCCADEPAGLQTPMDQAQKQCFGVH